MKATRENWLDAVKAICMMGVYLLHSEHFYGAGGGMDMCCIRFM